MKKYIQFLRKTRYSPATINQYIRSIEIFKKWTVNQNIFLTDVRYQEIISFIDDTMKTLKYSNNLSKTINRILLAIANYYDYLNSINPNQLNPAKKIRIKNPHQNTLHNLLTKSELTSLYDSIELNKDRDVRNKVMLGFLIFQALSVQELHKLSIFELKLRKGSVMIKGENIGAWRKGSASRFLKLEALQVVDLIDYIENIRPKILVNAYRNFPGRKPLPANTVFRTDQLLLSMFGSPNIKNSLHHMFINLRKRNPRVQSAIQIRQSVIALWVEKYNLRTVQYMAGHRYVSSTEYYKQVNINDLRREIFEYHPLG